MNHETPGDLLVKNRGLGRFFCQDRSGLDGSPAVMSWTCGDNQMENPG
jgi:hypothetical protein